MTWQGGIERLQRSGLRSAPRPSGRAVPFGFRFGLGGWPEEGDDIDDLIDIADRSLRESKGRTHDSGTFPRFPNPQEGA